MDLDRIARTTASTVARATRSALCDSDEAAESNDAIQGGLVESGEIAPVEAAPSLLTGRQVGVLASFGIGPENLDDDAQARMARAIGRLDGMLACTTGDETACAALGPAPISLSDASGADGSEQEILLEEADYTLSLRVSADPLTGETTSRLLYIDADGTCISGLSNQPVEALFAPEPAPEVEASAQPEDERWLSTLAKIDAEYGVLARAGGAMQVAGGAADLAVAFPLLLAPEPTMLTKVAAGAAGLRGLDDVQAGLRTLISGEPTETVTQTVATEAAVAMGAEPDTAQTIGLVIDVATGLLNPAGRLRHMTTAMSERLAKEAAEQAGEHSDDAARMLRAGEEGAESGARNADDAAVLGRKMPSPEEVRGTSPVPIPADALAIPQTKAAGYHQIKFRWDDGHARYDARWHTRTPGAPADQGDTWVIERKIHGDPNGKQAIEQVMVGDDQWVSMRAFKEAGNARRAGTATAEQEAMLAAGHFPAG